MGPLNGVKIVEFGGMGPPPMCGMLLADMGADILRIDRTQPSGLGLPVPPRYSVMDRSRRSVAVDLKKSEGIETVMRLLEQADGIIEGFRPGVMERLGLGPEAVWARNPRLVFGRVTGWGQTGPLAHAAGHDINYISLIGATNAIGRCGQPPTPPLNLVGDFGGGALYLALGIVAALEWILEPRGEIDGNTYARLTSNEFLSHFGNPTQVEAYLGELYRDGGLPAVKAHFLNVLIPLFKRQETNRRRH